MPLQTNLDVDKVLEKIWQYMKDNDLVTQGMEDQKEKIFESIADYINENSIDLTEQNLRDPRFQKRLMGAVISKTMGREEDAKECLDSIKNDKEKLDETDPDHEPNPELSKKIDDTTTLFLTLRHITEQSPHPEPKPKSQAELDEEKELEKNPELKEKGKEVEKQLTDCLINLNGGDDPRVSGEVQKVIQGVIYGNLPGLTNQEQADPKSVSFMVNAITHNAGKEDPLGLENIAHSTDLMLSGIGDAITSAAMPRPDGPK